MTRFDGSTLGGLSIDGGLHLPAIATSRVSVKTEATGNQALDFMAPWRFGRR